MPISMMNLLTWSWVVLTLNSSGYHAVLLVLAGIIHSSSVIYTYVRNPPLPSSKVRTYVKFWAGGFFAKTATSDTSKDYFLYMGNPQKYSENGLICTLYDDIYQFHSENIRFFPIVYKYCMGLDSSVNRLFNYNMKSWPCQSP
jgi:hypothetical protein